MKDLIDKEKENIGKRIKYLRDLLSLPQTKLAKAIKISKGTLNAMETGKRFSGDNLLAVAHFFAMSLSEFAQYEQPLPSELELRERIKKYHEEHRSNAYLIINNAPYLHALIEFRLIKEGYLEAPRTVNEIIEHCKYEYDLSFGSSVVSQALKDATKAGLIKRKKYNGRNYQYQAEKSIDKKS